MKLKVRGVSLVQIPRVCDEKGTLTFAEYETHLPWSPQRFFFVRGVPETEVRGGHAHSTCKQFLVCLEGSVTIFLDDGMVKETVVLDTKCSTGVLMDKMVWSTQKYANSQSMLLVLASEKYDETDYVRDYDSFCAEVKQLFHGAETKVPFLNLKAMTALCRDDVLASFNRILSSGQFVLGPEVEKFEQSWSSFCGSKYCVGVGSGLAAIHLMLRAAGIGKDDEIILASNSYIATLLAVSMTGARPVLVEPDVRTRVLDVAHVKNSITAKTRAILGCDLYGYPIPYQQLAQLAKIHNIFFFCDAAQSHGASRNGLTVGSLCDATAFSFYPSKNLGAIGEAGCVTTDNKDLADRIRILRNYGSRSRYDFVEKGFNERMDVIQAAIVTCKIPHLKHLNSRRAAIAQRYLKELSCISAITLPFVEDNVEPSWHLFVICCNDRDALKQHLALQGIETLIHYPVPPHLSDAYKELRHLSFPVSETLARTCLSIPICPFLSDDQVSLVISSILTFFNNT